MFALALSVALIPLAIPLLGHDEFAVRETASDRLRAWGPLALPYLHRASQSDDPEIRYRANALLRPWRCWHRDQQALEMLRNPWPVDVMGLWHDEDMRFRLKRIAAGLGCASEDVNWFTPDDRFCFFSWGQSKPADVVWALYRCRDYLGVKMFWPFNTR